MDVLQLLVSGLANGCVYGLIALGFVLIYKATEAVNFAQGDLMMLGAFAGLASMTFLGFPFWLSVPASIAAMAAFGLVAERAAIRPILGQPAFSIVMLTIGIGYILRGLTNEQFWGLPFWISVPIAICMMGIFGYLLDMLVLRRMFGQSQVAVVILTIALGFVLRFVAGVIWGHQPI